MEAFASGLPVVSTRVGGIPFLVEHEVTGLLVPKNDARALANAVIRLIEDPKLAKQIASEACSACLAYSPDNAVLEMERMLQQWHPMPDQRHS